MNTENGCSQQLYSYLGRAALWRNIRDKLTATGARLAPGDSKALNDLCAGVTWMQRVPPVLLASYRALYVVLRGDAAEEEEEINRDILRTVRAETGLLLDFSQGQRSEFAGAISRVLNALALVDGMGYCQGQNYVVDVMLKAGLPERETFCLFLYLLRQGHFHGIYRKEVPMLAGYMDKFEEQLRIRLPDLASHFEAEHYPPPLYALEWMTTLFGLAARPLISLVALDLFLAGARNPVIRLCISLLGMMEDDLLDLDQEGMLREFRSRAVAVDAEAGIVRALSEGGGSQADEAMCSEAGLGWSTGPDYLLVLRSRHCQTVGLYELREEARDGLLVGYSVLQDALLAVTRSLGWGRLRTCWLESCLTASSDYERYRLANESLRFVIANGGHAKAAAFMLGLGGADANGVDSRLVSHLHVAALFNRPDVARLLLMCGASPDIVGGVTRAAAVKGGQLWSPLEMAEEACVEGGELDEAGVAVGPAALFVLRGLVCLQCNTKLPRSSPCKACSRSYCKACTGIHFCFGRLDLADGLADGSGGRGSVGRTGRRVSISGMGPGSGSSMYGVGSARDGPLPGVHGQQLLGSALGEEWEFIFDEKPSTRAQKASGLRHAESLSSRTGTESDGDEPMAWSTLYSVLLGTWDRRPLMTSPKDRNGILDNAAAFVRACFPAQAWLQHHMEEDMGLCHGGASVGAWWGGELKDLGMRGEYFNPETLRASSSAELHRRMSWVMAEAGVPWENGDQAWCCPECFIIFGLNVFRHYCRGCGNVYCSAHAPPTPVSSTGRSLKLCWSCVLEGAVPLPSLADELSRSADPMSPVTARGYAHCLTPTPPASSVPACTTQAPRGRSQSRERTETKKPKEVATEDEDKNEGGFLSTLASLIETVAAPISPRRSRADATRARQKRRELAAAKAAAPGTTCADAGVKEDTQRVTIEKPSASVSRTPTRRRGFPRSPVRSPRSVTRRSPMRSPRGKEHVRPRSPTLPNSPASGVSQLTRTPSSTENRSSPSFSESSSNGSATDSLSRLQVVQYGPPPSLIQQKELCYSPPDPNRPVPQRGFGPSRSPSPARVIPQRGFGARAKSTTDFRKSNLQQGPSSSMSTASSTETGDEDDTLLQRGFGNGGAMIRGFPSEVTLKRGFGPR